MGKRKGKIKSSKVIEVIKEFTQEPFSARAPSTLSIENGCCENSLSGNYF